MFLFNLYCNLREPIKFLSAKKEPFYIYFIKLITFMILKFQNNFGCPLIELCFKEIILIFKPP